MKFRIIIFVGIFLLLMCATQRTERRDNLEIFLNSKMGILTFDDALFQFGTPTSQTRGEKNFIVERLMPDFRNNTIYKLTIMFDLENYKMIN